MGFSVEYRDSEGNLRLYHPDFVVSTKGNGHLVVETKGEEDIDIKHKDERIRLWCKDATKLTKSQWAFKRVDQEDFERYRFKSIDELISTFKEDRDCS